LQCFSLTGSIDHKRMTIEICKESPNEARQRPAPNEHEHGRARQKEGPDSAILGRVDQGQGDYHRR
jgi:hypothetical protein